MLEMKIVKRRVHDFIVRVHEGRYGERAPLSAEYTYDKAKPIPLGSLAKRSFKPIAVGSDWGQLWASAWFKVTGSVPKSMAGQEVVALVNLGSEGCVFVDGTPVMGLTDPPRTPGHPTGKRRIPIAKKAKGGESVDLLIEAAANGLFGYHSQQQFVFTQCELAVFNPQVWQLALDLDFLYRLAESLPQQSVRARRIWHGLNKAANEWCDGVGLAACTGICRGLLAEKAAASATTAWSVGHAHIDLGWLWPVWETRRKTGRTFATALRMIEEYPGYVFGASQPQAFQWVKEDYPQLYDQVKRAVKAGKWECQGAMWVEPDMNITGGESLVRQLLFGKRFFRAEFGKDVTNLWLPDVFGYSAALPQLLQSAGVTTFMTQKISWNESNLFPHHSFWWEGIDGTRIRTHFLPTNTYNADNRPELMIAAEQRFAQADVSDDWLNLYGIGDGGGGPGRYHIEMALRSADTDGSPKLRMAAAEDFFKRLHAIPAADLPLWRGELYLELHRGTYTTQSRMKRYNRLLEHRLRDAEFVAVVAGVDQRDATAAIWRDTLLNQFHDILPGSSIKLVYDEAHAQSERHLGELEKMIGDSLRSVHGNQPAQNAQPTGFALHNTLSWQREQVVLLPGVTAASDVHDTTGRRLPSQQVDNGVLVAASVPSMGWVQLLVGEGKNAAATTTATTATTAADGEIADASTAAVTVSADGTRLENALVRVTLGKDGTIGSMYDRVEKRETLDGPANQVLLWEDYPYSWDAWDISHYYRETTPQQATCTSRAVVEQGPLRAVVEQRLSVGSSSIVQRIVLTAGSGLVLVENQVEWLESHKQLRVAAKPAIRALTATYEIQFGAVGRPGHANTSWDAAQFEVAGQRFADVSQADYGFGLVNDCKYGHSFRDGLLELTLLRSPKDPDPTADIGSQQFVYGYYAHRGTWQNSEVLERAHELNSPLLVRPLTRAATASAAQSGSMFTLLDANGPGGVKIETVKIAEDDDGVIVRMYETRGMTQRVTLLSALPLTGTVEVNLLEEPGRKIPSVKKAGVAGFDSQVPLDFSPFQIRTFKILRRS